MPRDPAQEAARLQRKKEIALQQVTQFEDELSAHELNRARLVAAGQPTDEADKAIAVVEQAIDTTEAEADKIA